MEDFAISKFPRRGKCENTVFANGWHRAAMIPLYSVLDGGAAGDVCAIACLECGKEFNQDWFVLIDQPRALQGAA